MSITHAISWVYTNPTDITKLEQIEMNLRQRYASKYPWMVVYYTRNEERVIRHTLSENKGQTTPTRDNPDASSHMQQRVYHTDPSDKQI